MGPLTSGLAFVAVCIASGGIRVRRPPLRSRPPLRHRPSLRHLREGLSGRRARNAAERAIPDVVELLIILLRAGLTTRQSIAHLAVSAPDPARQAFAAAVARLDRGQPAADALEALPERLGTEARPVADLIGPADRYGLPLAPALEQLAAEARRTRQRHAEADARRLPVRLSIPLVACTLPSFVLLAIAPAVLAAISSLGGTAW